jgi:putative NADH-flavin reductase
VEAIGRPLIEKLVKKGYEVVGLANSEDGLQHISEKGAVAAKVDALDRNEVERDLSETRPDAEKNKANIVRKEKPLTQLPGKAFPCIAERHLVVTAAAPLLFFVEDRTGPRIAA